jgi:hypothetical protein
MPLYRNILHNGGLGCCEEDPSEAPKYLWILITFVGILGAILLVLGLLRSMLSLVPPQKNCGERYVLTFALVATLTAFAPLPLLGLGPHGFYDRYLIVFLPWLMLVIVASNLRTENSRQPRFAVMIGAVTFLGIFVFAVAATHDYLAANRVRWAALNRLLNEDCVKPERVDGGFEFNGLYLYDIPYAHHPGVCCDWWVRKDYVVSYVPSPDYAILEKLAVAKWLPWRRGDILIQLKINDLSR